MIRLSFYEGVQQNEKKNKQKKFAVTTAGSSEN